MIMEGLENYARVNGPWLHAWNAFNVMNANTMRVAVGQIELAALSARFMNERMCAYATFDGRVEPLVRRLENLTDQFADAYSAQIRTIYASWSDILREDRPLADVMSTTPERADERKEAKASEARPGRTRGDEKAEQRREASSH